eukprot:COSAG06_NODE_562_length_14275_cov_28.599041_11_plen_91_part_00
MLKRGRVSVSASASASAFCFLLSAFCFLLSASASGFWFLVVCRHRARLRQGLEGPPRRGPPRPRICEALTRDAQDRKRHPRYAQTRNTQT